MMADQTGKKTGLHAWLVIMIAFAFYGFFAVFDGVVMCADTMTYINMDLSREPFYPMFLAFHRAVFGEERYLFICVCLQSILAAAATCSLVLYLRRTFNLKPYAVYLSLLICLGVSALCRFAAGRASMYSNSILSEGICVAGFLLFFRYLIDYILSGKKSMLIASAFISLILISTRKQMYLTLILLVCGIFVSFIRQKPGLLKGLLLPVIVVAASVLLLNHGVESVYHMRVNGEAVRHFNDNRFMATVVFYTAEREYAEAIEDPEIRMLFEAIYDVCDSEGSMMHDAPAGLFALGDHFAEHYDMIQIDHMWAMIEWYAQTKSGDNAVLQARITDEITATIINAVRPLEYDRIAKLWIADYVQGLANTTARASGILYKAGLFMWLIYIAILIVRCIRTRFDDVSILGIMTLIASLLNIAIVASVIFCQTRYMIYNMPLFYISMLLMLTLRTTGELHE
ncbi:MAG: hypothetical protein J5509_03940 [Lachnospiraceae bacterium]|nr:hypothetical protein [Lachnospiraceae bacterium]